MRRSGNSTTRNRSCWAVAIKDGLAQGIFRSSIKPKQMAVFISTFLDGTLFRSMMFPEFNYRAAIRHMRTVVLNELRQTRSDA